MMSKGSTETLWPLYTFAGVVATAFAVTMNYVVKDENPAQTGPAIGAETSVTVPVNTAACQAKSANIICPK